MKRFLILVSLLISFMLQAQQVKVSYSHLTDSLPTAMQQYFKMLNISQSSVTLRGDFNGKRARLKKIVCDKGRFTEHEVMSDVIHLIFNDSIERLDFMAVPHGSDSLRITCFYPDAYNYQLFNDTVPAQQLRILMETYAPGDGPETPILAYSTGIPFNNGSYYCGLRDSGIDPWKWYEKYGIDGYVFYTLTLEPDTRDPQARYYIKLSKK